MGLLGSWRPRRRRLPLPPARPRDRRVTNLFIGYLEDRAEDRKPSLACSAQPPHNPYVAPEEFMGRFHSGRSLEMRLNVPQIDSVQQTARRELAGYYAMIENWDWNIGRIRQALDQTGLAWRHAHRIFRPRRHARLARHVPQDQPVRRVHPGASSS
ncbi:MAG: sulfatase-like hydrolase/transferase [Bryobacterales bacterium]